MASRRLKHWWRSSKVPPSFVGTDYSIELVLFDENGAVVEAPGLTGESGGVRIAQAATVDRPSTTTMGQLPRGALWSRQQVVAYLQNGLSLAPGRGLS